MASIGGYLPPPGSAVWRRDVSTQPHLDHGQEGKRVRHVVIRDAQIWNKPTPYVVYRVDVLAEHDHWYMYKRYSQFYTLHSKLLKTYGTKIQIPPKKLSGNLSKQLIDKRRQSLESYLQKLVHGESQIAQSAELMEFLDVPTHDVVEVADILTRHLYLHGDKLLEEATPISLSVNEMYAITKRLLFPRDAGGSDLDDVAADPSHLYSFVHQLECLRISLPPSPTSICCSSFEMSPFKSLHTLKMDKVPLSQVNGMVSIQQQLKKLSVHRSIHTLKEVLIEAVEEKRGSLQGQSPPKSPTLPESWRISATARLTSSRVIVQPWHTLHTLTLSHNLLTHLDDSLQVLPVLRELNLSHNQLQELHLRYLCLPGLEKLSIAHNCLSKIHTDKKVLERITYLNFSHNRLQSLNWIHAFVGVCAFNLSYNLLSQRLDLDKLLQMKKLNTVTLMGNPITSSNVSRLVLLAKFMHKSRKISLDGQEATSKEQAKLQTMTEKYGSDPDVWPVAKSLTNVELRSGPPPPITYDSREPSPQSSPDLEVSWQVQSSFGGRPRPLVQASSSKHRSASLPADDNQTIDNQLHRSFDHLPSPLREHSQEKHLLSQGIATRQIVPETRQFRHYKEEHYSVGSLVSPTYDREGSLVSLLSREDPDGQSDISSTSPEPCSNIGRSEPSSVSLLSPPPSTPLPQNESAAKPTITPAMIRSALESLQQIQSSKGTPLSDTPLSEDSSHNQICPEAVANALSVWMNHEAQRHTSVSSDNTTPYISPPPSTPLDTVSIDDQSSHTCMPISSSDLVAALSALAAPSRRSSTVTSGESSAVNSVPACTPKEGISEWLKLGFKPEDVIQALTALSLQNGEENLEDVGVITNSLSPIQEYSASAGTIGSNVEHISQFKDTETNSFIDTSVEGANRNGSDNIVRGLEINFDDAMSPGPPDFVFSPPDHGLEYEGCLNSSDCANLQADIAQDEDGHLVNSCSPVDDVLYS